jgi:hypothetical protein
MSIPTQLDGYVTNGQSHRCVAVQNRIGNLKAQQRIPDRLASFQKFTEKP